MGRLEGKSTIITGASSGMGKAAAALFGREGARLVLGDINATDGESVAAAVRQAGGEAVFVHVDVTRAADWQRLVATAVDTYGRLDVLVDNVGIWVGGRLEEMTEEEYARQMDVNLKGVWLGMKYAIPALREAGGGAIVCTASTSAFGGSPMAPLYSASKGAVLMLARSAALYLAKDNIRVNCVCPGATQTNFLGDTPAEIVHERFVPTIPLGRMGKAEDQAQAMLYLASDESSFVTGSQVIVDGGFLAQ